MSLHTVYAAKSLLQRLGVIWNLSILTTEVILFGLIVFCFVCPVKFFLRCMQLVVFVWFFLWTYKCYLVLQLSAMYRLFLYMRVSCLCAQMFNKNKQLIKNKTFLNPLIWEMLTHFSKLFKTLDENWHIFVEKTISRQDQFSSGA